MEWEVEYSAELGAVVVAPSGVVTMSGLDLMASGIWKAAEENATKKLLVDYRNADFEVTTLEVFNLPGDMRKLGPFTNLKVALVHRAEASRDFEFLENVYVNRGFSVRAFLEIEQAKEWLVS